MSVTNKLAIVCSLLIAAGCTNRETRQASYGSYPTPYNTDSVGSSARTQPDTSSARSSTFETPLAGQVKQSITADPSFANVASKIQVQDSNGKVTLTGTVANEQQKQMIEALAKNTPGVANVDNQLQVSLQPTSDRGGQTSRIYSNATDQVFGANKDQSSNTQDLSPTSDRPNNPSRIYSTNQTPPTAATTVPESDRFSANIQGTTEADRTLAKQMMDSFKTDPTITPLISSIKVTINEGQATLTGTVKSEDEKNKIESAVQSVSGVTSVDNQLQVNESGTTPENK